MLGTSHRPSLAPVPALREHVLARPPSPGTCFGLRVHRKPCLRRTYLQPNRRRPARPRLWTGGDNIDGRRGRRLPFSYGWRALQAHERLTEVIAPPACPGPRCVLTRACSCLPPFASDYSLHQCWPPAYQVRQPLAANDQRAAGRELLLCPTVHSSRCGAL